jgi:uncharacterized membrane protein/protein-disulfide isomerase
MRRLNAVIVVIAAALLCGMDIARLSGLWPCDVACQGGAYYQHIFGVSLLIPAILMHGLLFILALRDSRRGQWSATTIYVLWFLAGISIFYLVIAYALALMCTYCLLSHAVTLLSLFFARPFPPGLHLRSLIITLVVGALSMNALYHHTPVIDQATSNTVIAPNTAPNITAPTDMRKSMDRGRYYGQTDKGLTLYVALDLSCQHCAEWYPNAMAAWTPLIDQQRVHVVVLHMVRPAIPVTRTGARLAFAAAGLQAHAPAMSTLLGSHAEAEETGLIRRLADVIDAERLRTVLQQHSAEIDALIDSDQRRIKELGLGQRTPAIALEQNGKITHRWSGHPDLSAIIETINKFADGSL